MSGFLKFKGVVEALGACLLNTGSAEQGKSLFKKFETLMLGIKQS